MSKIITAALAELAQCDNIEQVQEFVTRQAERVERLEAENTELRRRVEEIEQRPGVAARPVE